jgi:hypothetical protein
MMMMIIMMRIMMITVIIVTVIMVRGPFCRAAHQGDEKRFVH